MKQNKFKPKLGQHFLTDEFVKIKIIEFVKKINCKNILEIGPGEGSLTNDLIDLSSNYAGIEIDSNLFSKLSLKYKNNTNVHFINGDAANFDLKILETFFKNDYILVGNLPYYSSNKIIRNFLSFDFRPTNLIVMMQKEVADSYLLSPPKMKFLSYCIQMYSYPELIMNVEPHSFSPEPKVESSILNLIVKNIEEIPENSEKIIETVKQGFDSPRKKLTNSFKNFEKNLVIDTLNKLNINLNLRPGNLTLNDWKNIHKEIYD